MCLFHSTKSDNSEHNVLVNFVQQESGFICTICPSVSSYRKIVKYKPNSGQELKRLYTNFNWNLAYFSSLNQFYRIVFISPIARRGRGWEDRGGAFMWEYSVIH